MAAVRGDEGAILLIVLFVTTVLAVLIGVVLTSVEVNLRNSTVAQNLAYKTYAADGGVESAIQRLREDPTACSDPTLSPWQQNNTTVTVSCTPAAGTAQFASGWTIVTTSSGPTSLSTAGGGVIAVNGPAYVAGGLTLGGDLTVRDGPLLQASTPSCPLTAGSGHAVPTCTTMPVPGGVPALPCIDVATCTPATLYNLPTRELDRPAYTTVNGGGECRIFLPGKYTGPGPLDLGPHNYFASGIYYFEDVDITIDGRDVIGGTKGASEAVFVGHPAACGNADIDSGVSDGTGVELILGGTSTISVSSNPGSILELFARRPAGSALEGAAGISIRTVPTVDAAHPAIPGYKPSSASNVFAIGGGSATQVAVHGLVYAPNAGVTVAATAATSSELSGGVVASTLLLRSAGILPGLDGMISTRPPVDSHQFFTISSTAQGGATKNVTTTAVIELSNDANRSVVIDSWVTNAA